MIGQRIRELRLGSVPELSQDRLAKLAGCHRNTIVRLESGAQNFDLATAEAIAKALGVRLVDLIASDRKAPRRSRQPTRTRSAGASR